MRGKFAVSILALIVLTFSSCFAVFGEEGPLMWSQTYGGTESEIAYSVVATSDGGYALAGYIYSSDAGESDGWLVKTDEFGNMEWNKTIEGGILYSLIETSDGYALAGETGYSGTSDFWLVKTDASGNIEWNRTYRKVKNKEPGRVFYSDTAYSLVATSDGGYALAGTTASGVMGGPQSSYCWLVKTDSLGNEEWNQTYGGTEENKARCLIATPDGGYALAGTTGSYPDGSYDFLLVKTDASGNEEWNQTYGRPENDEAYSLVETSDGGYALAGRTKDIHAEGSVYDHWLVKTDASGNMEWNQTYEGGWNEETRSLVETSDGGYALIGDALLFKTDAYGNMEWNRGYGGGSLYSLVETPDGVYVIAGIKDGDFWLIKTALPDLTAPNIIISSPQNITYATRSISLTFTADEEIQQWMVYSLDGTNVTIYDIEANLTWLSEGFHSIKVYARDIEGNLGASETTYFTIDITAPNISISSPQPITYATNSISLVFTVDEETQWMGYILDGTNVTIYDFAVNLTGLADGSHSITVYARDIEGNLGASETRQFTVDLTAPNIIISSPQNIMYITSSVLLTFTVDEETSWMGYSLDGQAQVTTTGNTVTLTGLSDGLHNIVVYATDTSGHTGNSETILFEINTGSEPQLDPLTLILAVALLISIISIIGLLIYLKRKQKH